MPVYVASQSEFHMGSYTYLPRWLAFSGHGRNLSKFLAIVLMWALRLYVWLYGIGSYLSSYIHMV